MPQPTLNQVHIDKPLTRISVAYLQSQENFVAPRVFPQIPVEKKSDKYFVLTKADWFRDEAKPRPDATESAGSGFAVSNDSYLCEVFAIHKDVGDQLIANADNPLNPRRDATEFVTQRMLIRQEKQWAADFFTTGVWATDVVGGTDFTQWSDQTGSDPISDIELGKETILQNTGFLPNTLVLGYQVFRHLKEHPSILNKIQFVREALIDEQALARIFGVRNLFVARAVENTAAEGATASFSFISGKNALLCYVEPNPGLLRPSAGYTFVWTGISEGFGTTVAVSRFRMENLKAERVEAQMAWDNKVVGSDLGYFFSAAVA